MRAAFGEESGAPLPPRSASFCRQQGGGLASGERRPGSPLAELGSNTRRSHPRSLRTTCRTATTTGPRPPRSSTWCAVGRHGTATLPDPSSTRSPARPRTVCGARCVWLSRTTCTTSTSSTRTAPRLGPSSHFRTFGAGFSDDGDPFGVLCGAPTGVMARKRGFRPPQRHFLEQHCRRRPSASRASERPPRAGTRTREDGPRPVGPRT